MNTTLESSPQTVNKDNAVTYYQPRFYVDRSNEDTVVQVELPGATRESLNLTVENKELILEAKAAVARPESWKPLHRESSDRVYYLRLRIGETVNESSIAATMADGVLTLIFPKIEEAKPKKITVK